MLLVACVSALAFSTGGGEGFDERGARDGFEVALDVLQRRRHRAPGEVHHGRGDGVAEDRELLGDHGGRASLAEPLPEPPGAPGDLLNLGRFQQAHLLPVEFSHRGEHHAPYAQVQAHADGV